MFDPNIPANGTDMVSAEMRSQFQGLKTLIDANASVNGAQVDGVTTVNPGDPAAVSITVNGTTLHFVFFIPRGIEGLQGQPGNDGAPFTNFVVDGVTSLNPTEPATVAANFNGSAVALTFGIPRGQDGFSSPPITSFLVDGVTTLNPGDNATVQTSFDGASVRLLFGIPRGNDGTPGGNGSDGGPGPQGAQGPPFAQAIIDAVNTLNPGDPATVSVSFDGSNVHFTIGIPRGNDGTAGINGTDGAPGEVTNAQLATAISGTSNNTNAVATMDTPFANDPPTLADMELMRAKFNELVLAGRR